jgi:hypothetical protein
MTAQSTSRATPWQDARVTVDLLSDDQATVDTAAAGVASVIDAAVATVPEARRVELESWIRNDGPINASRLDREGIEAGLVLAVDARMRLAGLPRHSAWSWSLVVDRVRQAVRMFQSRPLGAWLWVELLGAIPSHKRTVAEYVASMGATGVFAYPVPAMRAAVAGEASWRGILFNRLVAAGALTLDDKVRALGDPSLRMAAEPLLVDQVPAIETRLKLMLDDASAGTRAAIVRLLRTLDARIGVDGKVGQTTLDELETRLRIDPRDVATLEVWADLMQEQGDPRGQVLALELALSTEADPERALALSGELAALIARYRKAILGKPGGFPFREKQFGRGYISFGTTWRAMLRGKPETVLDKVTAFITDATTIHRPALDVNLCSGDHDEATDDDYRARCLETKLVSGQFQLVWPGTKIALPYQEAGHYPDSALDSTLRVNLASGKLELGLQFPFEDFSDPRFAAVYQNVAATLGRIALTPTGFSIATPTVDGKKMKFKKQRYAGSS